MDFDEISMLIQEDVDVEKLIYAIKKCRDEIEFLKRLKQKRIDPIDEKIQKVNNNEDRIKKYILSLMPEIFPKKKTVDFPGVGKITQRKVSGKWEIEDEEKFKEMLKKHGKFEDVVKITESISKRSIPEAASLLLTKESEDNIGVKFVEPESDLSLTVKLYEDTVAVEEDPSVDF